MVIWLTGISGAGKSTLARRLELELQARGERCCVLDADDLRRGLNSDLGFSRVDRQENVRRLGEVALLLHRLELVVIVACISPFEADRQRVRGLFPPGEFIEVHVDTPLAVAEQRDRRGLYLRARSGALPEFTGISSPYEVPVAPEVRIDTVSVGVDLAVGLVLGKPLNIAGGATVAPPTSAPGGRQQRGSVSGGADRC